MPSLRHLLGTHGWEARRPWGFAGEAEERELRKTNLWAMAASKRRRDRGTWKISDLVMH